jgi:hypothetical protein
MACADVRESARACAYSVNGQLAQTILKQEKVKKVYSASAEGFCGLRLRPLVLAEA